MRFDGKRALVTGGSRGIGLCVSRQLENLGATVISWDTKSVDVRDEKAVIASAPEVDILINNAGVFGPAKSLLTYSLAEWHKVIDTNLTGTFLVTRAVVPYMVKQGYGRVVNMASVVGRDAANPFAPVYSASKAGIIRMSQALGRELAKTGVLINCVAPSACLTDLFKDTPKSQLDAMLAKTPIGRFATVEEISNLVCWLASDEMTYSTGAVFDCSGGRHE